MEIIFFLSCKFFELTVKIVDHRCRSHVKSDHKHAEWIPFPLDLVRSMKETWQIDLNRYLLLLSKPNLILTIGMFSRSCCCSLRVCFTSVNKRKICSDSDPNAPSASWTSWPLRRDFSTFASWKQFAISINRMESKIYRFIIVLNWHLFQIVQHLDTTCEWCSDILPPYTPYWWSPWSCFPIFALKSLDKLKKRTFFIIFNTWIDRSTKKLKISFGTFVCSGCLRFG